MKKTFQSSLSNSSSTLFKKTAIGIERNVLSALHQQNLTNAVRVHVTGFTSVKNGTETKVDLKVIMKSSVNVTTSSQSQLVSTSMTNAIKSGSITHVAKNFTLTSIHGK